MARFRGTVKGQRGEASRLGSAKSGLVTRTNGWNGGVKVVACVSVQERDEFHVYATSGSSAGMSDKYLGYVDSVGVFHPAV